MAQRQVSLQRLRTWYERPETQPPDLAFITFEKEVSKPHLSEDDYYYERQMATWERATRMLPKCPEAYPKKQMFRFGFVGSPDIFVFVIDGPYRRARLFREEEVLVRQTQLVPASAPR